MNYLESQSLHSGVDLEHRVSRYTLLPKRGVGTLRRSLSELLLGDSESSESEEEVSASVSSSDVDEGSSPNLQQTVVNMDRRETLGGKKSWVAPKPKQSNS